MATNPESQPVLDDSKSQSVSSEIKSDDEIDSTPPSSPVLTTPLTKRSSDGHCWRRVLHIVLVCLILLVIWGGSILPIIFYLNPVAVPNKDETPKNMSLVPPIPYPYPCTESSCNSPLICNPKIGFCTPPCPWSVLTTRQSLALTVVDNTSIIINLTLFVVIIVTWIRSSQLRRFPNIIPLYLTTLSAAIALLLGIGNGMGKKKAFCGSEYMTEAHEKPTLFCTVQGAMIHYIATALVAWYLVYTINLLLVFVLNRIKINQDSGRAHIICSSFCWTLSSIPMIVVLTSSEKYNVMNMRYCGPATVKMNFYSTVLIVVIAQFIGCTCLFAVVHKFVMERTSSLMNLEQAARRRTVMNKVVRKLTMLMCAYSVTVALTYVTICIGLRNADLIKKYTEDYFKCLMFSPQCPKDYEPYIDDVGNIMATMSTALFSISSFFFLAVNEQTRALWGQWYAAVKRALTRKKESRESFQSSNDKTKISLVT